ncbi:MAG: hypothetical protein HRT69_17670, partial [Flavobacteriaceae bacterium]|nr:hypothetical protein [Flavobacteriaceae bacterium]
LKDLGLNVTEMTWRQYDNALGRFHGIDALAATEPHRTPYHFAGNNPILFSDPSGLKRVAPQEYDNLGNNYSSLMGGRGETHWSESVGIGGVYGSLGGGGGGSSSSSSSSNGGYSGAGSLALMSAIVGVHNSTGQTSFNNIGDGWFMGNNGSVVGAYGTSFTASEWASYDMQGTKGLSEQTVYGNSNGEITNAWTALLNIEREVNANLAKNNVFKFKVRSNTRMLDQNNDNRLDAAEFELYPSGARIIIPSKWRPTKYHNKHGYNAFTGPAIDEVANRVTTHVLTKAFNSLIGKIGGSFFSTQSLNGVVGEEMNQPLRGAALRRQDSLTILNEMNDYIEYTH